MFETDNFIDKLIVRLWKENNNFSAGKYRGDVAIPLLKNEHSDQLLPEWRRNVLKRGNNTLWWANYQMHCLVPLIFINSIQFYIKLPCALLNHQMYDTIKCVRCWWVGIVLLFEISPPAAR